MTNLQTGLSVISISLSVAALAVSMSIQTELPERSTDALVDSIYAIDQEIIDHTYGPLEKRYTYGREEPNYDRAWRIKSDSLYAERRRMQNKLNSCDADKAKQ